MKTSRLAYGLLALLVLAAPEMRAGVTLPKILADNMVLQRGQPVAIWGTAAEGDEVTVKFAGQEKHAQPGPDGRWQVALDPLKASATPQEMTITATNAAKPESNGETKLKNILVGEVWFCGGQSNMEYATITPSSGAPSAAASDPQLVQEIKTETYPQIRLFRVEKQTKIPQIATNGWTDCSGDALSQFSAIGFFFARNLQRELNVPVGMVGSYWGGSRLEQWIPPEAFTKQPAFAKEAAAPGPLRIDTRAVGDYYNSMIRDLAPFTLRGVLWYQGESNIIASNDGPHYADKMQALVDFWRGIWQEPQLPFYQVQLAPYLYTSRTTDYTADKKTQIVHTAEELPKLWEGQFLATRIPGVEIVPTTDLDSNFKNIHPDGKRVVGQRLANLALTKIYGKTTPAWQGPTFDKAEVNDGNFVVHFTNTGGKLSTRDDKTPALFEIAGADGVFKPATATISGDTVVLHSNEVKEPTVARLGWMETAQPNLVNKDGLPAYPFRSNGPDWHPTH